MFFHLDSSFRDQITALAPRHQPLVSVRSSQFPGKVDFGEKQFKKIAICFKPGDWLQVMSLPTKICHFLWFIACTPYFGEEEKCRFFSIFGDKTVSYFNCLSQTVALHNVNFLPSAFFFPGRKVIWHKKPGESLRFRVWFHEKSKKCIHLVIERTRTNVC